MGGVILNPFTGKLEPTKPSYSPATKIVAPAGSGFAADYYTDGTADEVEINAAISAVNALGAGKVLLKTGNYTAASGILPLSNVTIEGEGMGTYVTLANGANVSLLDIEGKQRVVVKNMYIDGNGVNQTIEKHCIRIGQASSYVDVLHCKVINGSHHNIISVLDGGFSLNDHIRVIGCELSGAGAMAESPHNDGVCVAMQASYGLVKDNFITDTSFCGIEIYHDGDHCIAENNFIIWNGQSDSLGAIQVGTNNENSVISGNIITGAGVSNQAGIKILANYTTVSNNTIFDLTNGKGVWVSGATYCAISNNTLKNITQDGIYLEGTYNTISANTITDCLNGINVRPTAFYDILIGNIISGNQNHGIVANSAAKNISYIGNHCVNNGQATANSFDGINSQSASSIYANNQCYDNQGTPTQRYGIRISGSSSANFSVIGNYASGNITGDISLNGTSQTYINSQNKGDDNITLDGTGNRTITTSRNSSGAGNLLNIQAPAAQLSGTNLSGGVLRLSSGISTGTGRSDIQFYTAQAGSSGTSDSNPILTALLTGNGPTKFILGNTTTDTVNGINISGQATQEIYIQRITTSNTAGKSLTIQAGGATVAATNKNGGALVLTGGISTGTGTSQMQFQTAHARSSGEVSTISINAGGSGYVVNDVLTISSGGGTGGTATVNSVAASGQISAIALNAGGTGYTAGDILTISGGTSGTATVLTVDGSGVILTLSLTTGGTGYSTGTNISTTGGTGTGGTIDISSIYSAGQILTISLTTFGSGYAVTSGASTTGGTGTSATINILTINANDSTPVVVMTLDGTGNLRIGDATAPTATVDILGKMLVNSSGLVTKYNNISTVSNGQPSEVATIDTASLTANVGASTLYAVPSTGEGLYRVSAYIVETTAASLTSTLPNVQVVYTDKDSNTSVTLDVTPILGVAGIGQTGALTANTAGTIASGIVPIYVKASTTIQYQTVNYASNIAGMTYAIHLKLEAL